MTERRLDRLRTIKSRMVRLNTRVETVCRVFLSSRMSGSSNQRRFASSATVSRPSLAMSPWCIAWQIRELLEKLLDDDDDMRDMNLAAR